MKIFLSVFSYGGLHHRTFDALFAECLQLQAKKVKYELRHVGDDALISRTRSKAMTDFLHRSDCDVFFMLDHDIAWTPGDILATCDLVHLKKVSIGGFYSTRARGVGIAGRLKASQKTIYPGKDELHEAEFLPGGFVAFPRKAVEAVAAHGARCSKMVDLLDSGHGETDAGLDTLLVHDIAGAALRECIHFDGKTSFLNFFGPIVMPSTLAPGKWEYLSEDWSMSRRLTLAGQPQFLWSKPVLAHFGEYGFNLFEAAQGAPPANKLA